MALAVNWTRNSEQEGDAVRVTKSHKDLQSVAATSACSANVSTEIAGSISSSAFSGCFQSVSGLWIHFQKNRSQPN